MSIDEDFMRLALNQAALAQSVGEVPVGAVLVRDGQVIASGHNTPISEHDPCGHAEIHALRRAGRALGNYRLNHCTLYVTLEPCAMCAGAMFHARLKEVVFGASDPKTGVAGGALNLFENSQLNHHTHARGGVMARECSEILKSFFASRRRDD